LPLSASVMEEPNQLNCWQVKRTWSSSRTQRRESHNLWLKIQVSKDGKSINVKTTLIPKEVSFTNLETVPLNGYYLLLFLLKHIRTLKILLEQLQEQLGSNQHENWATGKEDKANDRYHKHSHQNRRNGSRPVGYSGQTALTREQCGV
jgi:hypothetical protein